MEFGIAIGGESDKNFLEQITIGLISFRSFNFGRGRKVVDEKPNFHATVKQRMESTLNYTPKAKWKEGSEVYVH